MHHCVVLQHCSGYRCIWVFRVGTPEYCWVGLPECFWVGILEYFWVGVPKYFWVDVPEHFGVGVPEYCWVGLPKYFWVGLPEDFWVGVVLHLRLVRFLRVEPEALAGSGTAGPTRSLLGWRFTYSWDKQRFHTDTRVIHLNRHPHMYKSAPYKMWPIADQSTYKV